MTSFKWNPIGCGVLAAAILTPAAHAELTFNGFASIRAVSADADGVQGTPFANLKGDGDISFKDESLFAIQASADLGEGLSATVQLLAEGPEGFDVGAEWAYLSYDLNDSHKLSVGRFANPIFFQSQYENVGYAHNYATLPRAVYIGFDFNTIEGIALDSSFDVGDYVLQTKLLYGNWDGESFFRATNSELSWGVTDLMAVNATLVGDWWNLFAGGFTTEIEGGQLDTAIYGLFAPSVDALVAAGGATTADAEQFRNALAWNGLDGVYWYAGFNGEYNNVIFEFEYASYAIDDGSDAPNDVYYAALGYRFDSTVITLHYENYEQDTDYTFTNRIFNPVLNGVAEGYMDSLAIDDFDAWGIDIRYDFHPSAAFKFGYVTGERDIAGIGDYDIISAGVDVVF